MGPRGGRGTRPRCPPYIPSITLVEPGPVVTDFEGKLLEQVSTAEFPDTDPDTLHYFRDFYLPASRELFRSVGQSPQDVAQVSGGRGSAEPQRRGWGGRDGRVPHPANPASLNRRTQGSTP